MNKKIEHLVNLLDDEDEQSACFAMAELLTYDDELNPILKDIQETNNPCLRRRVHQLQSILSIRRRRRNLPAQLNRKQMELFEGLCELHFLWYDNDSRETIDRYWIELEKLAEKFRPDSLEKLAYFMRKSSFSSSMKEEMDADYLCIGIALEDLVGMDFILCAIAYKVASAFNLKLEIIKTTGDFALFDPATNTILLPKRDWHCFQLHKSEAYRVWTPDEILKLASALLYYCAVSTDSFRYIYTIGKCLAALAGEQDLDFLPYPLNTRVKA